MRAFLKYKLVVFFCFCISISNLLIAQTNFNTARFDAKKNDKGMVIEETSPKNTKQINRRGWLKKIFERKEKPDLVLEIDSLKNLIIENEKEHKNNIAKIESSLAEIIKLEVAKINEHPTEKNSDKKNTKKNVKICMPLKTMLITSPFGIRKHPIDNEVKKHNGVDLRADYERVYAVMDGQIIETGFDELNGLFLKIAHSDKLETCYLHLSEIYYKKGENVKAGFIIARSGNTGKTIAPHLHFSVKDNEKFVNPITFLKKLIEINNIIKLNQYGAK